MKHHVTRVLAIRTFGPQDELSVCFYNLLVSSVTKLLTTGARVSDRVGTDYDYDVLPIGAKMSLQIPVNFPWSRF